jgi:hypothetical protein
MIAEIAVLVMFYMFSAILAQVWPLAVVDRKER